MLYLGCHLSSSKGYATMGKTALSIGANTFQFFTRNPRGGAAKSADPADAATLVQMQRDGRLGPLVAHAPYTLNPCSKDERTREFAREVFADDLQRMELTPGNFYNFHPGSHVGQGIETIAAPRRKDGENVPLSADGVISTESSRRTRSESGVK